MTAPSNSDTKSHGGAGRHVPVMRQEVLAAIAPNDGEIYADGTYGDGGYSIAMLEAADCRVVGIDRDPDAIAAGAEAVQRYAPRLSLLEGRFGAMDRLLGDQGLDAVDGVALDLGVSSRQLDDAARGFSFRFDGPIDMRMSKGSGTAGGEPSAVDAVNTLSESALADIIYQFGEEKKARRVARAIVTARRERPIRTTHDLAALVRKAVRQRPGLIDAATRTFQALRIYVNDEMGELGRGLSAAERILAPGGRLAVVSFHSLEDGKVKAFLKERSGRRPRGSRHQPPEPPAENGAAARAGPTFELIFKAARRPSQEETARNPRARSARLRAARRTAAPAWETSTPGGSA